MTIEELNARLRRMTKSLGGKWPRINVVIGSEGNVSVYVGQMGGPDLFKGHGRDLAALLDRAQEAIDGADPILLARTLGIEPIVSAAE